MNVKSYKDLIVWQKSILLSKKIYEITKSFPKEELFGITSQIRRASVSIACNIAEGHARNSTGEFKQFIGISKGSLAETETLIFLSKELNLITNEIYTEIDSICTEISKMLSGLLKSLTPTLKPLTPNP